MKLFEIDGIPIENSALVISNDKLTDPSFITTDRLWFIHALRAIACLLVVYKHLVDNFWVTNFNSTKQYHFEVASFQQSDLVYNKAISFINSIFSIGAFGVALFFLVSGFVIPLSLKNKGKIQFLISRFFRIWPVYIVAFSFTLFAMLIYKKFLNHDINYDFTLKHILLNTIPFQRLFGEKYLIGVFWTLEMEIKFYLTTTLLWWVFGSLNKSRCIIGFSFLMFFMALFRYVTLDTKFSHVFIEFISKNVIHCNPFYLTYMYLGTCFYNHYEKKWNTIKTLICVLILLSICICINYYYHPLEWRPLRLSAYIQALIFFSVCYLLKYKIPYSRAIENFANISYPLYLVHSQNGYIIMAIIYYYTSNPYLSLVIALFILTNFSYILHITIELPLQVYGKKISNMFCTLSR